MTICCILGIFDELVHSKCKHNECEFFGDFQTLCSKLMIEDEEESFAFLFFERQCSTQFSKEVLERRRK